MCFLTSWIMVFWFIWMMFSFIPRQLNNIRNYWGRYLKYYNKTSYILRRVSVHSSLSQWNFWAYKLRVVACQWKLVKLMQWKVGQYPKMWMKYNNSLASATTIESLYSDTVKLRTHLSYLHKRTYLLSGIQSNKTRLSHWNLRCVVPLCSNSLTLTWQHMWCVMPVTFALVQY